MKQVITKDGSVTFFNEHYKETYHSVTGAIEESFKKFVFPSKIPELAEKESISILDVCFGLGYNSCAAIDLIHDISPSCRIRIVALEKDEKLKDAVQRISPWLKHYFIIKEAYRDKEYNRNNVEIRMVFGNAETEIKKINETFDAIFHDPFSPKKNPELWTEDFFSEEYRLLKKKGRLTTYSCARVVRDNLKKSGFVVEDGPRVGRRGPSTIAVKQ